ncbi:MAG: anti-sigma regulatory factor [Actinomycetota bacterium]|nr:anti-sigma regulatory factor [Actinomycetota bacterium]
MALPDGSLDAPVLVTVPFQRQYLGILRSVTAGVAARMDFPYDTIDDLCLAVDEACAQLLGSGPASLLTLAIGLNGTGVELIVATDASVPEWPPPGIEEGFSWQVLTALVDEARFERSDHGLKLRLRKALSSRRGGRIPRLGRNP